MSNTSAGNIVWWPALCGNDSLDDAFWADSVSVYTGTPDLTSCFQQTALTWATCGVTWLVFPAFSVFLSRRTVPRPAWGRVSRFNLIKLVLCCLLIMTSLVVLFYHIATLFDGNSLQHSSIATVTQPAITTATYVALGVLSHWAWRAGLHTSGTLAALWLLQAAAAAIALQSAIRAAIRMGRVGDVTLLTCACVTCALTLVQLVICLFVDLTALAAGRGEPRQRGWSASSDGTDEYTPLTQLRDKVSDPVSEPGKQVKIKPNPRLTCNFLSDFTFWWFINPILFDTLMMRTHRKVFTGFRRPLTAADIWDPLPDLCTSHQMAALHKLNPARSDTTGPSDIPGGDGTPPRLMTTLRRLYLCQYTQPLILRVINTTLLLINPFIMRALMDFVQSGSVYAWRGYCLAVLMCFFAIAQMLAFGYYIFELYIIATKVKTLVTGIIYRKAMRLSSQAKNSYTTGEVVNMMSVDAQKIHDAAVFTCELVGHSFMIILGQIFLWQLLGPACMAGLVLVMVVMPTISAILGNSLRKLQVIQMKYKDERIKLTSQVVNGIKVLKLYAWEPHFQRRVAEIRDHELRAAWWAALINACMFLLCVITPVLVALTDFGVYTALGHVLDAQTAFTSLALIQALTLVLSVMPTAITALVQGYVSLKRLDKFLDCEDRDPDAVQHTHMTDVALEICNGSFTWGEKDRPVLTDISLKVPHRGLVAVVGVVGSGKSSVISALVGDMHRTAGTVCASESTAYVSQQAWIQNLSFRDNILFGRPYNKKRYNAVIDACALRPDLQILPGGDSIEIGERGINLSGGQKARVSLARAVYQDCDVYLLDDPLSAVDSHVGKHIFNEVIGPEGILKNKTRVLVTHSLTHLVSVDSVVVMSDGRITETGPYATLLASGGVLSQLINTFLHEAVKDELILEDDKEVLVDMARQVSKLSQGELIPEDDLKSLLGSESSVSGNWTEGVRRQRRKRTTTVTTQASQSQGVGELTGERLTLGEGAEVGTISWSVVTGYVQAATVLYLVLGLGSLAAYIICQVFSNIWLSEWTQDAERNITEQKALVPLRLGGYGGLGSGQALAIMGLAGSIALGGVAASRSLHSDLLTNILRCPMAFFDTNPVGRVINRFSRDMDQLDTNVPQQIVGLLSMVGAICSSLIVVLYSVPFMAAVIAPLAIIYVFIQRFYMRTARQIKRVDSVCRSPIFSFFSESLSGTSVIRAFGQVERFTLHSDRLVDLSQAVWLEVQACARWVSVYTDYLGDFAILGTAIFTVVQRDSLDSGTVGLALSSMITIGPAMQWALRTSAELETYIVAVERIKEYSEIEKEAAWDVPETRPVVQWPEEGGVAFQNYSTRYRPGLELVLRDLNLNITAGEKVGVVGRTGAGKSSMTLALFRIIESATGNIDIDGVNVSQIGLHDLRSKITIIPQDPVLFSGSLRFNIDPASSSSDAAVWRALQQAHLQPFVERLPNTLQYECGEDGKNLSVGQRQLVCLARALLRKTQLLVLDEATAAVDLETDELIQATIRKEFSSCTVITIAHRINTILDYDRVIVMAAGVAKEFDKPSTLLDDQTSTFHAMAKDAALV